MSSADLDEFYCRGDLTARALPSPATPSRPLARRMVVWECGRCMEEFAALPAGNPGNVIDCPHCGAELEAER